MDFSKYGFPSPEWLAFIARNPAAAQDGFSDNKPTLASHLRHAANTTREITSQKLMTQSSLTKKINISTLSIPSRDSHTIPLRRYSPPTQQPNLPGLIYFHGGGFLFGSQTTDDYLCATIAESLGVVVLGVIYRHKPDHTHPAQHNDAQDALAYIEQNASSTLGINITTGLSVLGISAGAALAATAVLRDMELSEHNPRRTRLISGVVLSIPWLLHVDQYPFNLFATPEKSAKMQCRDAPVIPWPRLKMFSDLLRVGDPGDPLLNTALVSDSRLGGWPKTSVLVAGMDPLRDDGLLFAKRLEGLRIPTRVYVFPGLPHGFRRRADLPASKVFDTRMLESIRWTLGTDSEVDSMEGWHEYMHSEGET
ncbi:Alpha/Beta hydrolase protein [Aspergillus cavernicola]|uniref:Alpha/Beta hydrolase protein n=1 Tax=Aspergillus cavernicola TaxID=176166 RepID=A0ABR4J144_9EURO